MNPAVSRLAASAALSLLTFLLPGAASAEVDYSENVSTPAVLCSSQKNAAKCLKGFSDLWIRDLETRMEDLTKNCLENSFCSKQLADLASLWNDYSTRLQNYLIRVRNKKTAEAEHLVNLQYHLMALGYGCKASELGCVSVRGEKYLHYSLEHLVTYQTGLSHNFLWNDQLREAAVMEIDDALNRQYKDVMAATADDEARLELKDMEIAWIRYKEKMLNYLEDPLASGMENLNYFNSDMFLMLTSLHQAAILGMKCPGGGMKCLTDEKKITEAVESAERNLAELPPPEELSAVDDAPSVIDASEEEPVDRGMAAEDLPLRGSGSSPETGSAEKADAGSGSGTPPVAGVQEVLTPLSSAPGSAPDPGLPDGADSAQGAEKASGEPGAGAEDAPSAAAAGDPVGVVTEGGSPEVGQDPG